MSARSSSKIKELLLKTVEHKGSDLHIPDVVVYYYGTKNNPKQNNTFFSYLHHFLLKYKVILCI